jgi:DNA-binding XRE family transcriptional regulator
MLLHREKQQFATHRGRFHPNLRLAFKITRTFGKQIAEVFIYDDT